MILLTMVHVNCMQYIQKGKGQFSAGFGQECVSFNGSVTHSARKRRSSVHGLIYV